MLLNNVERNNRHSLFTIVTFMRCSELNYDHLRINKYKSFSDLSKYCVIQN